MTCRLCRAQREMNAYTFGLSDPRVVCSIQPFQVMDAEELSFIIGHELGHVALGHTWLNSLIAAWRASQHRSGVCPVSHGFPLLEPRL